MAAEKYLYNNAGVVTEKSASQTSAGAADAGKIVALGNTGRIDESMMPVGLAADTASIVASEALAAGDLVNIWDDAGTPKARKADASMAGKEAQGFVLSAVSSAASATVYFEGSNTQMTGLLGGKQFLSATVPGKTQSTAPSSTGQLVQVVGFATSATTMNFQSRNPIVLA